LHVELKITCQHSDNTAVINGEIHNLFSDTLNTTIFFEYSILLISPSF